MDGNCEWRGTFRTFETVFRTPSHPGQCRVVGHTVGTIFGHHGRVAAVGTPWNVAFRTEI